MSDQIKTHLEQIKKNLRDISNQCTYTLMEIDNLEILLKQPSQNEAATQIAVTPTEEDNAINRLKAAYLRRNFVILDTETTGLDRGEVVQIAIIGMNGETLLDTLVKPKLSIPYDAQRIHGITDETVAKAPRWDEIAPQVQAIINGKDLLVYNAIYDRKMMHQSGETAGMTKIEWREIATWVCVMEAYAEFHGDWNAYRGNYRWQKLTDAAWRLGLERKNAHSALGDCLMTLGVVKGLAQRLEWGK